MGLLGGEILDISDLGHRITKQHRDLLYETPD